MKLIDADKFIKQNIEGLSTALNNTEATEEVKECFKIGVEACLLSLEIAHEVDAEPVRHGHWIEDGHHICCSECCIYLCDEDREGDEIPTRYCPNCGAKMDEMTEDEID